MSERRGGNWVRAAVVMLGTVAIAALVPSAASAHSLDSSTISTHVSDDGIDATITVSLQTLDEALAAGCCSGLGVVTSPLGGVEDAAIGHPWVIVSGLAVLAAAWFMDHHRPARLVLSRFSVVTAEHVGQQGRASRSRGRGFVPWRWIRRAAAWP